MYERFRIWKIYGGYVGGWKGIKLWLCFMECITTGTNAGCAGLTLTLVKNATASVKRQGNRMKGTGFLQPEMMDNFI